MPMTQQQAEAEAIKREAHKSKHFTHMRWEAVHTSVKGWHVALVECPFHAAQKAHNKARDAFRSGDMSAFMDAASDALMAKVRASLASVDTRPQDEDPLGASLASGAVPEGQTPKVSRP